MDSVSDIMQLCRLCLVRDEVNVPIFEEEGDIRQIFLKISACLPVKVSKEDNLPKSICDGCSSKLEALYQFWNTSANSEKKLIKWLNQAGADRKLQHSMVVDPVILKQEVVDVPDDRSTPENLVPDDLNVSNDDPDYLQQQLPYQNVEFQFQQEDYEDDTRNATEVEPVVRSRKRRGGAIRSVVSTGSEDEGNPDLLEPKIAKTEEESEESGNEDQDSPTYSSLPPATDNEQPGPSGVGKSSADAPAFNRKRRVTARWSNRLPEIDIIPVEQDAKGYTIPNVDEGRRTAMVEMGYKNPFTYVNCPAKTKTKPTRSVDVNAHKWTCIICNASLTDKRTLIEHYEEHKNELEGGAEQSQAHVQVEDYFKCVVCTREFTSSRSYEKHLEVKHGENRYACEQCNKTYKNSFQLCLHNYNAHSTDQTYKCIACEFITTNRSSLKSHIDKHEEDYKNQCEICDKRFITQHLLDEHRNSHTSAMPFQCEICMRSFPYARYLISHKKSIHADSFGSSANKCEMCDQQFAHRKSLVLHVRSHTGENAVLCDMCGKSLSSTEHLKQHLRIHTGYKPHACSVCGKGFAKKSNLTLHERVHSGEKPYICRECGKCFSQRSTLVIHERYHSGERPYSCPLCNKGFVAKGLLGVHIKSCSRILQ